MKAICVLFFALSFMTLTVAHSPYESGQELNVYASSGLKLRAHPSTGSEVIDIIPFGSRVTVINTFEFSDENTARIDWIDGHWILVEYEGMAGYLFDGYLSPLPFPGTESEICTDGYSYAFTLGEYIQEHYGQQSIIDSSTQYYFTMHDFGIKRKIWQKEDHQKIEIEWPGVKINEVLNLMRTMTPSRAALQQFERSLLFMEDIDGNIEQIKITLGDPVTLTIKENGNVLVKASGYAGC